ncbi:transmembrane protein, rhomboid family [Corynebacterium kutscheri]|uniref:Putative membrane protein n=1 Tax=Corynebacterium kutscheri TaxID=35755 RepID=A0A0F6TCC1_9CORY|nr:rhomboid family intramembrane serine protease [Corynebacterium kutscheri]AKE40271.1 putative membrane protein [Corynebacterium kutscheri]VEH05544.1 transmembrane protein, rhomboid family [Corynebacterium kutscheri]VEH10663.1 transmembrane protein, rhomboid family [Corynebacterium kutscheri]VEH81438.1 transmembrane protein, rhomboid family [Corynebacterium kutscheri]
MTAGYWRHLIRTAPTTCIFGFIMIGLWAITALESRSISASLSDSSVGSALILFGPAATSGLTAMMHVLGSMFIHVSISHLAVNLFMLIIIGAEIERFLGSYIYAAVFIIGGIGAAAAVVWFDYTTPTAGASGALYALMAVLIGMVKVTGGDLRAPIVLVAANVIFSVITPEVSLWGHLGGLFTGFAMLPIVGNWRVRNSPRQQWLWLFGVTCCVLLAIFARGWLIS